MRSEPSSNGMSERRDKFFPPYSAGARMFIPQRNHVSAFGSQITLPLDGLGFLLFGWGGCSTTEPASILAVALDIRFFFLFGTGDFGTGDRSTISLAGFLTLALAADNVALALFFVFRLSRRSASDEV
jgi:hypothetical protein